MRDCELSKDVRPRTRREEGIAVLIALIALSLFSLFGLYMTVNATTELRMSDNYETHVAALYAAKAGLSHTRELLKGIQFNDLLKGPDGTHDTSVTYLAQARLYSFRNPISLAQARALDILSPSATLSGIADDGLISTGKNGSNNGTPLVPLDGIALTVPNPYGSGTITTGRYFVKVTDNNGEARELAGDVLNDPFIDGDGEIIVRSLGIAQTIREGTTSGVVRANSVAVLEARFRLAQQFNLNSPFVVEGNTVQPASSNMFSGNSFLIDGLSSNFGVSTIDTNLADSVTPYADIYNSLATNQRNKIRGVGSTPSMTDITTAVSTDVDKSKLLDPNYLYNFATNLAPTFADNVYQGPLKITSSNSNTFDLGNYDYSKPYNDPSQRPVTTIVQGDLEIGSSGVHGGGVLIVTGKLSGNGSLSYDGLILVIGEGYTDLSGVNVSIHGGIYTVNVKPNGAGVPVFGTTKISLGGNSDVIFDSSTINMGVSRLPASQRGVREVLSAQDPS